VSTVLGLGILAISFFVLVAGLIILRRGAPRYLAAWGRFVATVLRGAGRR
jgi:hypothetical protein